MEKPLGSHPSSFPACVTHLCDMPVPWGAGLRKAHRPGAMSEAKACTLAAETTRRPRRAGEVEVLCGPRGQRAAGQVATKHTPVDFVTFAGWPEKRSPDWTPRLP